MTIQGEPTIDDSPESREHQASRELYEREDYLRREEYLSDEDLRARIHESIRTEQKSIDTLLGEEFYILSGSGKVHTPTCSSIGGLLDRAAMWQPYLDDLERVRDWHGSNNAPPMPVLRTRAGVEALTRYEACGLCVPPVDHRSKRRIPKNWQSFRAGSLGTRHFGKVLFTDANVELGTLERVSTALTQVGLEFKAEFSGGAAVTDTEARLQYKMPSPTGLPKDPERGAGKGSRQR